MKIRKARLDELDDIMEIYEIARGIMRDSGNANQWINGYPARDLIQEDIACGNLYLCEEARNAEGVFALVIGDDPTYAHIEKGAWLSDKPYGTVHRIGSRGRVKGLGTFVYEWCLKECGHVRTDTHGDNVIMRHMMEKMGYKYCGIIYAVDGTPRLAYEKEL